LLALLWAIAAPVWLYLHNNRDGNEARRLRALAGMRLGAAAGDYATNMSVSIPRTSVEMVRDIAASEERSVDMVASVVWISSAFVLALVVTIFEDSKNARKDA